MLVRGGIALAVVTGGIALGAMLGAAANPEMKMPREQPWQGGLQTPIATGPGYIMVEAPPEDLSPYQDSYAPTWAHEEVTDWELDYPDWTYSDLIDETLADPSLADERPVVAAIETQATAEAAPQPADPAILATEPPIAGTLAALY